MNQVVKIIEDQNAQQERWNFITQNFYLNRNPVISVIAIANKMEDLEETYAEGIETEEEVFLEGLKNKKSLAELEKQYSKKVKEIRRIYEKSLKKELDKERENLETDNKTKTPEKNEKQFQVQNLNLEKNWWERKKIEISSSEYRIQRKIKYFIQLTIPNYFIFLYYKTERILKDFFNEIRRFFENVWENISEKILNVLSYIKNGFIKITSDMKRIIDKFKRKKKKDKEGEKKKERKNADKDSGKQKK
jgi:hypothetical protein